MATNKNITMKQFNGVDYDTLYPKTVVSQIDDVYSKDETSNLFLPKAGGSMGGILDMNGNRITNLPTPTSNSDPATKGYVDGIAPYDYLSEIGIPKEMNVYIIDGYNNNKGTGTIRNYLGYSIVNANVTELISGGYGTFYKDNSTDNAVKCSLYCGNSDLYIGIGDNILTISRNNNTLTVLGVSTGVYKWVLPFNVY